MSVHDKLCILLALVTLAVCAAVVAQSCVPAPVYGGYDQPPVGIDRFDLEADVAVSHAILEGWEAGSPCSWNGHDMGPCGPGVATYYPPLSYPTSVTVVVDGVSLSASAPAGETVVRVNVVVGLLGVSGTATFSDGSSAGLE